MTIPIDVSAVFFAGSVYMLAKSYGFFPKGSKVDGNESPIAWLRPDELDRFKLSAWALLIISSILIFGYMFPSMRIL